MTQQSKSQPGGDNRLRIALLRGDDHHNLYLERLLTGRFNMVCVVSEPGAKQRKAIWRRKRWKDALAAEYHRARRTALGKDRYRQRYFDPAHDDFTQVPLLTPLVVSDINDERVGAAVQSALADICVMTCTTRLSTATIQTIGVPIINIHGGYLPDYRGCHCFFSAILDRRFDAIGSTIHFVNAGLDTGDVIEVARPAIRASDDPERLYSRAERLAAQRLAELLEGYEQGIQLLCQQQAFRGRLVLRRHRTPVTDIRFWWERKTGRLVIPNVPGPVPLHPWEHAQPLTAKRHTLAEIDK